MMMGRMTLPRVMAKVMLMSMMMMMITRMMSMMMVILVLMMMMMLLVEICIGMMMRDIMLGDAAWCGP